MNSAQQAPDIGKRDAARLLFLPWNSDLLNAVGVSVFAIVLADILEKLVVLHTPESKSEGPWLFQHCRIFDRDFVSQQAVRAERNPFLDAHVFRMRNVLI